MALALAAATTAAAADPFQPDISDVQRAREDALLMSELLGQYADAQAGAEADALAFAHAPSGVRLATADCSPATHAALAGQHGVGHGHPHGRMFNFGAAAPEVLLESRAGMGAAAARALRADRRRATQGVSSAMMRHVIPSPSSHVPADCAEMQALLRKGRLLFYRRADPDAFSSVRAPQHPPLSLHPPHTPPLPAPSSD